jgi:hypothetical protein
MPHSVAKLDQGVPHSTLDAIHKRPVYATAFGPTKRGFAGCGGQVTSMRLDELAAFSVETKKPQHLGSAGVS